MSNYPEILYRVWTILLGKINFLMEFYCLNPLFSGEHPRLVKIGTISLGYFSNPLTYQALEFKKKWRICIPIIQKQFCL